MVGGWLVDHGSWRTIFLINPAIAVPTILIAAAASAREASIPTRRKGSMHAAQRSRSLDWACSCTD